MADPFVDKAAPRCYNLTVTVFRRGLGMERGNGSIIVAGLMLMDIVVKPVDEGIFGRDATYVDHIDLLCGGDALNVAVNLGKLGERVRASALVGADAAGELVRKTLSDCGVDCSLLTVDPKLNTSVSVVMARPDGERSFVCRLDSTQRYDASGIRDEDLDDAGAVCIGSVMALPALEGGPLRDLFERCRARGVLTAMDATGADDGRWPERIADVLPFTDLFLPSLREAVAFTGTEDPVLAARTLRERGVRIAGVKLGEKGCYIDAGDEAFFLPALPCPRPVDLTGAGDAFMAGFLYGMLRGWALARCAGFATALSNSCIRSLGASTHQPDPDEILREAERLDGLATYLRGGTN